MEKNLFLWANEISELKAKYFMHDFYFLCDSEKIIDIFTLPFLGKFKNAKKINNFLHDFLCIIKKYLILVENHANRKEIYAILFRLFFKMRFEKFDEQLEVKIMNYFYLLYKIGADGLYVEEIENRFYAGFYELRRRACLFEYLCVYYKKLIYANNMKIYAHKNQEILCRVFLHNYSIVENNIEIENILLKNFTGITDGKKLAEILTNQFSFFLFEKLILHKNNNYAKNLIYLNKGFLFAEEFSCKKFFDRAVNFKKNNFFQKRKFSEETPEIFIYARLCMKKNENIQNFLCKRENNFFLRKYLGSFHAHEKSVKGIIKIFRRIIASLGCPRDGNHLTYFLEEIARSFDYAKKEFYFSVLLAATTLNTEFFNKNFKRKPEKIAFIKNMKSELENEKSAEIIFDEIKNREIKLFLEEEEFSDEFLEIEEIGKEINFCIICMKKNMHKFLKEKCMTVQIAHKKIENLQDFLNTICDLCAHDRLIFFMQKFEGQFLRFFKKNYYPILSEEIFIEEFNKWPAKNFEREELFLTPTALKNEKYLKNIFLFYGEIFDRFDSKTKIDFFEKISTGKIQILKIEKFISFLEKNINLFSDKNDFLCKVLCKINCPENFLIKIRDMKFYATLEKYLCTHDKYFTNLCNDKEFTKHLVHKLTHEKPYFKQIENYASIKLIIMHSKYENSNLPLYYNLNFTIKEYLTYLKIKPSPFNFSNEQRKDWSKEVIYEKFLEILFNAADFAKSEKLENYVIFLRSILFSLSSLMKTENGIFSIMHALQYFILHNPTEKNNSLVMHSFRLCIKNIRINFMHQFSDPVHKNLILFIIDFRDSLDAKHEKIKKEFDLLIELFLKKNGGIFEL